MTSDDFFSFWREQIKADYIDPRTRTPVACGLLAVAFGKLLAEEGKGADVVCFHRTDFNEGLSPAPYPQIEWYGHVVAMCGGIVYDPSIEKPMPVADYKQEMFPGQDVYFRRMEPAWGGSNDYIEFAKTANLCELPGKACAPPLSTSAHKADANHVR